MTLLVTAFGAFDGGWNSSDRVLRSLSHSPDALRAVWRGPIAFELLPVDTEAIDARLEAALEIHRPSHLLLMGQATARDALSLERTARNVRDLSAPDDAGRRGPQGPVRAEGPAERQASWPDLDGLAAALRFAGLPARVSDDAGTHLCNQTLYLALERNGIAATFIHLPLAAEQVADGLPVALRRRTAAAMPLAEMTRAVRLVLRHTRAWASSFGAITLRRPPGIMEDASA